MAAPSTETSPNSSRKKRSLTGPLTIAAIIMFGLSTLVLLMRAPRSSDPAPVDVKFAVPSISLRVFALDVRNLNPDAAIAAIIKANAHIVLLQGVRMADAERIGLGIGMSRANEKSGDVIYPAQNFEGPAAPIGNAIYSRWPLYEGRSIPNRGGSFGVWAIAVIDGSKIMVASMRTTDSSSQVLGTQDAGSLRQKELSMLVRAYDELGKPPIVIAGQFQQLSESDERILAHFGKATARRGDTITFAPEWSIDPVDLPADLPGICVVARPY